MLSKKGIKVDLSCLFRNGKIVPKCVTEKFLRKVGTYDSIIFRTSYLHNVKVVERLYHITSNLYSVPVCENNNPCRFLSFKKGYSNLCTNKSCIYCLSYTKEKRVRTNQVKYGGNAPACSEEVRVKMRQTSYERYGHDNIFSSKEIQDKIKSTKSSIYGNEFFNNRMKARNTLLDRYGEDNPSKIKEFQDKKGITLFKNHQTTYRKLFKDTIQREFGVKNISQLHLKPFLNQLEDTEVWKQFKTTNDVKDWIDKFNLSYKGAYDHIHRFRPDLIGTGIANSISRPHQKVIDYLLSNYSLKLLINDRQIIKPYEIDILIEDASIGFEIDGVYWHRNKDSYHKMKDELALAKGIRIFHITDEQVNRHWNLVLLSINSVLEGEKYGIFL